MTTGWTFPGDFPVLEAFHCDGALIVPCAAQPPECDHGCVLAHLVANASGLRNGVSTPFRHCVIRFLAAYSNNARPTAVPWRYYARCVEDERIR